MLIFAATFYIYASMISEIRLKNYGPVGEAVCSDLAKINVLIGHNGSGKTFLLKSLYSALKTIEQYKRGKEPRSAKELLAEALYWTFQTESLGSLVKKANSTLSYSMSSSKNEVFEYSFGVSTTKGIQNLTNTFSPTNVNNIFIPAKEIVSIQDIILRAFEVDKQFGFDKSYVDLSRALSKTLQGRNVKEFADARKSLTDTIGGKLEYDDDRKAWVFKDNNKHIFEINVTSEGIKRLSILDLLLGNHYLSRHSVVIIDEAEANLHPEMISRFMDILVTLAKSGLQVFISTHSYFVIKNLYILAHQQNISIPTYSFESGRVVRSDLKTEMPDNPIINESINIYRKEISL